MVDDEMPTTERSELVNPSLAANDTAIQRIREALRGLRFGTVNVIVQDGVVVQIDRTEKYRIRKTPASPGHNSSPE